MSHQGAGSCREMLTRISAYLDGELDERSCRAVKRHCRNCPECSELFTSLEAAVGLCRQAGARPLPEPVRELARTRVREMLDRKLSDRHASRYERRRSLATISKMPPNAPAEHKARAPRSVGCFVVTISDTRTAENDTSGDAIADLLSSAGHRVVGRTIVKDDPQSIREAVMRQLANPDVEFVIATGGTGISSRDSTYEVVGSLLEKRLDGFGELFRMLSYQAIGTAAMMSRAVAGLAGGRIVVSLPGSPDAVRLALEKLLLPEMGHLVQQAKK
jgi:molybdenum cofactor biosynthesis protein B